MTATHAALRAVPEPGEQDLGAGARRLPRWPRTLGFDHAWLVDHLVDTDGAPEDGCLESWTLLAAIAARTTRIRLGVLVSSNTFRHPALLLKEAVTVDHISGGRLILGIGTGWHEDEHRRYGIDLPARPERVDRFEEAVELISLLMSQERTTFDGPLLPARRRASRAAPGPAAADPDPHRRPSAADAAHRRPLRRPVGHVRGDPGRRDRRRRRRARRADRRARRRRAGRSGGTRPRSGDRPGSTSEALRSTEAYLDFVRRHHRLGFTDFSTVRPEPGDEPVLRTIATEIIPELRAGRLLD